MKKIWLHISVWTRSFLITFQLMVISFFDIKATFKILGWSIKWENIPMNFWTLLNYTQLASCILSGYLMHVWFCHSIHWSLENLALLIYVDFPSGNMFHYTLSKIIDIIVNADLIRRVYRYWETIKLLSSGTNYHTMFHFFFLLENLNFVIGNNYHSLFSLKWCSLLLFSRKHQPTQVWKLGIYREGLIDSTRVK
jgi:hypothetical protein